MKIGRLTHAGPIAPRTEAVILFWVGAYRMAIGAEAVAKIRKDRGLMPAEIGCSTIVSAHELFGLPHGSGARLLVLRRGSVAVRVDKVERMIQTGEARPLPDAFQGFERGWYLGLAVVEDLIVPLVNPEAFELQAQQAEDSLFDEAFAFHTSSQEAAKL